MNDPLGGLGHEPEPERRSIEEPPEPSRLLPPQPRTSTIVLLIVLGAFFITEGALADFRNFADDEVLLRLGSLFGPLVQAGDWWRIGSYAFLHIGPAHFLMNAYALWVLMRPIEGAYGSGTAIGLFAASALAGGAASCAASLASGHLSIQAAGASGGIFGLFGAYAALWIRLRKRVPAEVVRAQLRMLFFNLLINAAIALVAPVDNFAHGGGLLAGLLLGLLAPLPVVPRMPWHLPVQAALLCAALALAASEGAAVARAVHPVSRKLVGRDVEARIPWMLAPIGEGIARTPGGLGLNVAIARLEGPADLEGKIVQLGERRFWLRQGRPSDVGADQQCAEMTLLVSDDDEHLVVRVCCSNESCEGTAGEKLAENIAATLRSTR